MTPTLTPTDPTQPADPATKATPPGLVLFPFYPKLMALGREGLQRLCDEWCRTDEAAACNVASVEVGEEAHGFDVHPRARDVSRPDPDASHRFAFLHGLMAYLITHGVPAEDHALYFKLAERLPRRVPEPVLPPEGHPLYVPSDPTAAAANDPGAGAQAAIVARRMRQGRPGMQPVQ